MFDDEKLIKSILQSLQSTESPAELQKFSGLLEQNTNPAQRKSIVRKLFDVFKTDGIHEQPEDILKEAGVNDLALINAAYHLEGKSFRILRKVFRNLG